MARYECNDCNDISEDECVLTIETEKTEKYPDSCLFGGDAANWVCCGES